MIKKLRLLITEYCPKNCVGCCNKNFDLNALPIVDHYDYDEIILTDGEPFTDEGLDKVFALMGYFRYIVPDPKRKVYVYTSNPWAVSDYFDEFDGMTLSLHSQCEVKNFTAANAYLNKILHDSGPTNCSLQLHIFKGVELPEDINLSAWKIKKDIEWIENCPLPAGEVFMRLKHI